MKKSVQTTSYFAAILIWGLSSILTVFIIHEMRDKDRLIRDKENEQLLNILFSSLRNYDNFGSAIESSELLQKRVKGLAVYDHNLEPIYRWGKAPAVFDEELLEPYSSTENGRYTIPDKTRRTIKFIIHTERMFPAPSPEDASRQRNFPRRRNRVWPDSLFWNTLVKGKYLYIDIAHPVYWRNKTFTNILFFFCEIALLVLVLRIRNLYIRNGEYRERIEAQKNLVILGTAASTLAHEIKNPLLSIRLQTGILSKILSGTGQEEIAIINEEVDRLTALIYRVNDLLRDAEGSRTVINSYELVRDISRRLCGRNIIGGDSIRDGLICIDSERIRSVLENVIRNALESGGAEENVEASITRLGGSVVIAVFDRGKGIAEGDLERVFDPFFTSKSAGTGIGLSISRRFIEAVKGSIVLENREGGGTAARITLAEYMPGRNAETDRS
ncbi:MAG: HAMP domain-containing histidine kinase [Treponema sp.]|nr:HAMP domain-containing histidine kinase [Treponema sp.]